MVEQAVEGLHHHRHAPVQPAVAESGPVREGSVGGGTGMICHEFKGGIGSASRRLPAE
ncbi:P1 family peptidase, partial [Pseudomonas aeruginosa]|uniref:P1 family peptidase n=1 Tax=Pseudomonas aeruginosa TaxID=287 RepID=UPI001FB611AD